MSGPGKYETRACGFFLVFLLLDHLFYPRWPTLKQNPSTGLRLNTTLKSNVLPYHVTMFVLKFARLAQSLSEICIQQA